MEKDQHGRQKLYKNKGKDQEVCIIRRDFGSLTRKVEGKT